MQEAGHRGKCDRPLPPGWRLELACFSLVVAGLSAYGQNPLSGGALIVGKAMEATPINQPPDAVSQLRLRRQRSTQRSFDAANALRQRQLADETAKLLLLARDLSAKLAGADADLSPLLIREIDTIEILAHDVQNKMTLTIGIE